MPWNLDPDYWEAHCKVYESFGSAKNLPCVSCGESAYEWAYQHPDKDGPKFSNNPEDYAAMCRSCHRRFDWSHKPPDVRAKAAQRMGEVRDELHRTHPGFNSPIRICDGCGMKTTAMALGTHQKATGHRGYVEEV